MPTAPTYPGVYVQELPSGVRTLTGVATSIAAFVGRAPRGDVDEPIPIQSYPDFERAFGGLSADCMMTYAVRHFFQNGGGDAQIVRVVNTTDEAQASVELAGSSYTLTLTAIADGDGGNDLSVEISNVSGTDFDLTISRAINGDTFLLESFTGLDGATAVSLIDGVSAYVTAALDGTDSGDAPAAGTSNLTGGLGKAAKATLALPLASAETLTVEAKVVGEATNDYVITIDHDVSDPNDTDLFNLTVYDGGSVTERYGDVTVSTLSTRLTGSTLIQAGALPSAGRPAIASVNLEGGDGSTAGSYDLAVDGGALLLEAANEGSWGNRLQATVDHDVSDSGDSNLFNLVIERLDDDGEVEVTETFYNVSISASSARYLETILEAESALVGLKGSMSASRPRDGASGGSVTTGASGDGHDGQAITDTEVLGAQGSKTGIYALDKADLFNLLVLPPLTRDVDVDPATWSAARTYCGSRRAMLIVDAPASWSTAADPTAAAVAGIDGDFSDLRDNNAALYFPRVKMADSLKENRLQSFAPGGVIAGLIARTDGSRGVWKAPAGTEARLLGVRQLAVKLTDAQNGQLNPLGINCLRTFPVVGSVSWGARTTNGADRLSSDWKYLPVRRLALYIEESLFRGTQWVVFEPNDEPLWSQIRLNVGSFMNGLFRQGAFKGSSPRDAYLVKCDSETTTQDDINKGIVNIIVGFAPLKPAEFVIIKLKQLAGQVDA